MPATGALTTQSCGVGMTICAGNARSLVGPARDRMHDADAEALDLRLTELDLGFGGRCGHEPDEAERKDYDGQDLPTAAPWHRVKRLRHR